jgi:hypothetical protein
VKLHIGPLPAAPARAFLDYAEATLEELSAGPDPSGAASEIAKSGLGYLGQWRAAATGTEVFEWVGDAEPLIVERFLLYWLNLARYLGERAKVEGKPRMPQESLPVLDSVLGTLFDALESEGGEYAEHARLMRDRWPS